MSDSDWEDIEYGAPLSSSDEWEDVAVGPPIGGGVEGPGILGSAWQGIKDTPWSLVESVKAIPSGLSNIYESLTSPVEALQSGTLEQTVRGVGGLSSALAGAGTGATFGATAGAPLAPFTLGLSVPVLGAVGGALGGAAGLLGFNKLNQLTGADEPTTPEEDLAALGYMTGQGLGGSAIGAGLALTPKLIGRALPLTRATQEAAAGRELLANAGKEGRSALMNALNDAPEGQFGPMTYAEMAGTPSAAAFQEAIRKIPGEGSNALEAALMGRETARLGALQSIAPDALSGVTAEARGGIIQPLAEQITKDAWAKAKAAYEGLSPADTPSISVAKAKGDIAGLSDRILGKSIFSPEIDTSKLLQALKESPEQRSIPELTALQQDIGATIGKVARANPKAQELPVLYGMRDALEKSIDDALESGTAGTSVENIEKLRAAKDLYRQTGKVYGAPVITKEILKRGPYGDLEAGSPASSIPREIIKTPESAKQFMAAFGENAEMVKQARGTLLDEVTKAQDQGAWLKEFKKRQSQFQYIFGEDAPKVQQVLDDIASIKGVGERATRASRGQSFTTQGMTVAQKLIAEGPRRILKILGGKVGATVAGAVGFSTGGSLGLLAGYGLSELAQSLNQNIQGMIAKGMADPALLKLLTERASEANITAAVSKMMPIASAGIIAAGETLSPVAGQKRSSKDKLLSQQAAPRPNVPYRFLSPEESMPPKKKGISIDEAVSRAEAKIEAQPTKRNIDMKLPASEDISPLLKAVKHVESRGRADAVSEVGAIGLHQIMPDTGKDIAKELGIKEYDLFDPETNEMFAEHYLRQLLKRYDGDVELALAAYHSGYGRIDKLLKAHRASTLGEIKQYLGPVGRVYAKKVIAQLRKQGSILV